MKQISKESAQMSDLVTMQALMNDSVQTREPDKHTQTSPGVKTKEPSLDSDTKDPKITHSDSGQGKSLVGVGIGVGEDCHTLSDTDANEDDEGFVHGPPQIQHPEIRGGERLLLEYPTDTDSGIQRSPDTKQFQPGLSSAATESRAGWDNQNVGGHHDTNLRVAEYVGKQSQDIPHSFRKSNSTPNNTALQFPHQKRSSLSSFAGRTSFEKPMSEKDLETTGLLNSSQCVQSSENLRKLTDGKQFADNCKKYSPKINNFVSEDVPQARNFADSSQNSVAQAARMKEMTEGPVPKPCNDASLITRKTRQQQNFLHRMEDVADGGLTSLPKIKRQGSIDKTHLDLKVQPSCQAFASPGAADRNDTTSFVPGKLATESGVAPVPHPVRNGYTRINSTSICDQKQSPASENIHTVADPEAFNSVHQSRLSGRHGLARRDAVNLEDSHIGLPGHSSDKSREASQLPKDNYMRQGTCAVNVQGFMPNSDMCHDVTRQGLPATAFSVDSNLFYPTALSLPLPQEMVTRNLFNQVTRELSQAREAETRLLEGNTNLIRKLKVTEEQYHALKANYENGLIQSQNWCQEQSSQMEKSVKELKMSLDQERAKFKRAEEEHQEQSFQMGRRVKELETALDQERCHHVLQANKDKQVEELKKTISSERARYNRDLKAQEKKLEELKAESEVSRRTNDWLQMKLNTSESSTTIAESDHDISRQSRISVRQNPPDEDHNTNQKNVVPTASSEADYSCRSLGAKPKTYETQSSASNECPNCYRKLTSFESQEDFERHLEKCSK